MLETEPTAGTEFVLIKARAMGDAFAEALVEIVYWPNNYILAAARTAGFVEDVSEMHFEIIFDLQSLSSAI